MLTELYPSDAARKVARACTVVAGLILAVNAAQYAGIWISGATLPLSKCLANEGFALKPWELRIVHTTDTFSLLFFPLHALLVAWIVFIPYRLGIPTTGILIGQLIWGLLGDAAFQIEIRYTFASATQQVLIEYPSQVLAEVTIPAAVSLWYWCRARRLFREDDEAVLHAPASSALRWFLTVMFLSLAIRIILTHWWALHQFKNYAIGIAKRFDFANYYDHALLSLALLIAAGVMTRSRTLSRYRMVSIGIALLSWAWTCIQPVRAMMRVMAMTVDVLLFPLAASLCFVLTLSVGNAIRDEARRSCQKCGYFVAPLLSSGKRCPECGTPFSRHQQDDQDNANTSMN